MKLLLPDPFDPISMFSGRRSSFISLVDLKPSTPICLRAILEPAEAERNCSYYEGMSQRTLPHPQPSRVDGGRWPTPSAFESGGLLTSPLLASPPHQGFSPPPTFSFLLSGFCPLHSPFQFLLSSFYFSFLPLTHPPPPLPFFFH